jgi:hypothetical protein
MADRNTERAAVEHVADDVRIAIWADFWMLEGTAAQISAEGIIPADFDWPAHGRASKTWTAGGLCFKLNRRRPASHKGSFASWQTVDYWGVQVYVEGVDYRLLDLARKTRQLEYARWLLTEAGKAYRDTLWLRFTATLRDGDYQKFKARLLTSAKGRMPSAWGAA